ncbi:hypothetical protein [Chryseobacterium lathyri]|uniref:hypothetical protein n=1 Tax=Chryseobacterium lathyri TaxID=395933 RepID=UPI002785169F|nr:hypothetical protein [Chryseobacterium lathyri]MDQ0067712.1 hypothetical protein [Chryseobacterium lathyri]
MSSGKVWDPDWRMCHFLRIDAVSLFNLDEIRDRFGNPYCLSGAAENEQLKFHNPPQMTLQVFEALLPFAMAMGVDQIWGEKFDELLKRTATEYHNTWYYGGVMNHYACANTLNSSLTQSIQSASTKSFSSSSGSGGGGGGVW